MAGYRDQELLVYWAGAAHQNEEPGRAAGKERGEERKKIKVIIRRCLIRFLIGYFRRTLHIPKLGGFYKNEWRLLGGLSDSVKN